MKKVSNSIISFVFFASLSTASCNNDSDLIADYVLLNNMNTKDLGVYIVNDYFEITPTSSTTILDVLSNDNYTDQDKVKIIETSTPTNGTVKINEDSSTLTYTQSAQIEGNNNVLDETSEITQKDTFTYTIEVINEDQTVSTEIGIVEIAIVPSDSNSKSANLIFSSGFEGVNLSSPVYDYQYLEGKDTKTGYTWPIDILGSSENGIHRINDDGGSAIDNRIETITGHTGSPTSALFQRVNYDVNVTQTPYQINNITENPKELYMSYWMKTDDTAVVGKDIWRAIWEYKTNNYASYTDGFRMIAFMATDNNGVPYWSFQGDTSPQSPIWLVENKEIPLIMNEWFKVEYYIKWSDGPDGYASMKVNGQLIGEHSGATTSNSDDMYFIMLTQVYGNSYPMHQWVDDIEIWDGLPY